MKWITRPFQDRPQRLTVAAKAVGVAHLRTSANNASIRWCYGCAVALALPALWWSEEAIAAPARKMLTAAEIRQSLIGKVITDEFHWRYFLKPDGAIDAIEMGRPRKGKWVIQGNQLCLEIFAGAAPDECWKVVREGNGLVFRAHGQDIFDVTVQKPAS